MEKENGRYETMEAKLHHVTLRQKSKVPRTRLPQRFEYVEVSGKEYRNGAPKKDYEDHGINATSLHHLADTDENKEWLNLIGQRVCISGVKPGILRYYGKTNFAEGCWCGVELDEPVGKNNGTVNGVIYFTCKPNHGIFAPVSKVSKLNDLSACSWPSDTILPKVQESHYRHSSWDYNVGFVPTSQGVKFIKTSTSDPTSLKPKMRPSMPNNSQSFSYDSRNITEKRRSESLIIKAIRNFETTSEHSSRRGKSFSGSFMNNSSSSHSLNNYETGKNAHYFSSNVMRLNDHRGSLEPLPDSCLNTSSSSKNTAKVNKTISSLPMAMEEFEQYLQTPTNSGQASPLTAEMRRLKERSYFEGAKLPDAYFSSYDYPDLEDEVDNDDQMSIDYDESLGILTPSQMKDFTLCPDFPTSSDVKGFDFPSSESFDDINELPEDEQVHDVSVQYVPECRNVEITKQTNVSKYSNSYSISSDSRTDKILNSTDKFLSSISQKKLNVVTHPIKSKVKADLPDYERPHKINNILAATNFYSNPVPNLGNEVNDKDFLLNSLPKTGAIDVSKNMDIVQNSFHTTNTNVYQYSVTSEQSNSEQIQSLSSLVHESKITNKIQNFASEELNSKNYDTDSSRDSLMQGEPENIIPKEKLTVSWEDCIPHSNNTFNSLERPESVYTVASSDTGYQEDGEIEGGMATSMDSTDSTKRFSTASRDSCIVADEVDAYKIAESNSTSGYSTGLSDSCCNDRPEDDLSSKPLTEEELQDSVGPCDSEDGFSFQENNSLSKDSEMMNAEMSDVTVETVTAICHDSTSEALCETMVEDTTLTEINDSLMSPEEAKSSNLSDQTENCDTPMEQSKNLDADCRKASDHSSVSTASPAHSTPEKKLNKNRPKVDSLKKQPLNSNKSSRSCDEERRKQIISKSPKKNVMSKIKAMIEATSCKNGGVKSKTEVVESKRVVVSVPKRSRWEAVTSKIAASLAEEKTKPKAKREIKSRVDTNLMSARQQVTVCKSPRLDSSRNSNYGGDGTLTPVSSKDKRPLSDRNNAINLGKEVRAAMAREAKQDIKSQRHLQRLLSLMAGCAPVCRMTYAIQTPPGPGRSTTSSRPTSPVAASESSTTSVSVNSHNSRSKIAHWKGSTSTVASSIPPPAPPVAVKRQATSSSTPRVTPQLPRTANTRTVTKKPVSVPKIRITSATSVRMRSPSPATSSKPERSVKQSRTSKEQTGVRSVVSKPVRPPMWLSKAELTQEIQRLGTLCETRTKELNRLKMETKHVSIGFDAFAALFKYMVDDLNGLSVPVLSNDLQKTLKQLELAKQDLAYYEREVEEMKAHHSQELNDLSNKLFEVYQGELTELSAKHQEELNNLNLDHQQQIENLSKNLQATSDEKHSKQEQLITELKQELITQREELQLYQEREIKDVEEKHALATKTLQEHIEQLQKKCAELNQHSMSMEDAMRKDTDSKLQWVTSRKIDLEKEVESLKTVLEMKNKELHSLRIQTLEMEKQLEDLPLAREKIKMLQARAEDLEALMIEKTNLERKLCTENQLVKDSYEKENKINKRLSMENEELQWRLRQAENSLLSGSFAEVSEYPDDDVENEASSPVKTSPAPQMSRSVFFTFVDKDNSSPRSQYKKITPGFAASYRASPGRTQKSSSAPSPRRSKSHSEPPQPPTTLCTPRKVIKQASKRSRSGSDSGRPATQHTEVTFSSVTGSMTSSVSSESSVFGNKEQLLEEHEEQIMETLQILREQRSVESPTLSNSENEESKESSMSPDFGTEDLSRSSEFSDPKTYYHMTFPVPKEAGMIVYCDSEETGKRSTSEETTPSVEEPTKIAHSTENNENAVSKDLNSVSEGSPENPEFNTLSEVSVSANNIQSTESHSTNGAHDQLRTI
nr:uncharacterized protein LOC107438830 [Parasteatoda tepidariorum]